MIDLENVLNSLDSYVESAMETLDSVYQVADELGLDESSDSINDLRDTVERFKEELDRITNELL